MDWQSKKGLSNFRRHHLYKWDVNDCLRKMDDALTNVKVSYNHYTFGNLVSTKCENE